MPEFRRGMAAVEEAAEAKGGGGFRSFVPRIKWREDGETKYLLVITPPDEVGTFDLHEWVPVGTGERADGETYTKYETFLSRKDPFIAEDHDRIEDDLDRKAKTRCVGVAVELDPVFEVVEGRKKPVSFEVKTDTYTRNTDDGEVEVTQPLIGLVIESAQLIWQPFGSLDQDRGPLTSLPIEVKRQGTDQNTRYQIFPYDDKAVDLSGIVDYFDGISFLADDTDEVIAAMEGTDDMLGAAQAVAEAIFNKWLIEVADGDRYEELTKDITELPDRWGGKKKSKATKRPSRPARKSQREKTTDPEPEASSDSDDSSGEESEPTGRKDKFAALKAKVENKKKAESAK